MPASSRKNNALRVYIDMYERGDTKPAPAMKYTFRHEQLETKSAASILMS